MSFALIPVTQPLHVEGHSDAEAVGDFSGMVVAIAVRGSDPVSMAALESPTPGQETTARPEGLLGWGTTSFLICDPDKPEPVWVAKGDISRHELRAPQGPP